jgi:hypothetical protein
MIATPDDAAFLDSVIKFIGNEIEQIHVEGVESASMSDAPPKRGRGGAKRPSKGPRKSARKRPAAAKKPRVAPRPVAESTPKNQAPKKQAPRKKAPPRKQTAEEPVLGLGPNAPAFFQRPVRTR